jgi:rhamnosyltransferase
MGMETMVNKEELSIAILMSTYNATQFLNEQIESIRNQSYRKWELYIRDDGSDDSTREMIRKYAEEDDRIVFLNDKNIVNLGVINSFMRLLKEVSADFYMFCDQDDVWKENKIQITLNEMLNCDYESRPVLVHTDLQVVDEKLNTLSRSFINRQKLPTLSKLNNLVIQNNVTGCTVMINQKLKDLVNEKSTGIRMHDWWFALVAKCFGEIRFISEATILYRQHSGNVVGSATFLKKITRGYALSEMMNSILLAIHQDKCFLVEYSGKMSQDQLLMFNDFTEILSRPSIQRIKILRKYDVRKYGKIRNIAFKLCLFIMPKIKESRYEL